jgi:hypothetical protein
LHIVGLFVRLIQKTAKIGSMIVVTFTLKEYEVYARNLDKFYNDKQKKKEQNITDYIERLWIW